MACRPVGVWQRWVMYGLTAVSLLAALFLTILLEPLQDKRPYLLFFPVILLSAWWGGLPVALGATVCTIIAVHIFVHAPVPLWAFTMTEGIQVAVFGMVAGGLSVVQSAFAATRQRFIVTLTSIGDAVIVTDAHGRVTFMNPVAATLTGWTEAEAHGRMLETVFPIFNDATRQPVDNPVSRVLSERRVVGLANHTILRSRSGREVPIDDSAAPVLDPAGRLYGVVLVFRDITARRQAELAREYLAAIVESADDAIISKDLTGRITSWNAGATQLFGYTASEAVGQSVTLLIPPELQAEEVTILERLRRGERITHYETVRQHKNGQHLTVSLTISPIQTGEGRIVGASKIARDITAKKQTEAALRRQSLLLELAYDPIFVWDLQHGIVTWNRGCEELYGFSKAEALGRRSHELLQTRHPLPRAALEELLRREGQWSGEVQHTTRDGRTVFVESRHQLLEMDGQSLVLETNRDITARRQAEAALRATNATLEQRIAERTATLEQEVAERQRLERVAQRAEHFALLGRLAAGVSHEIRNPLGAIVLHVNLLEEELQQPSQDSATVIPEALTEIKTSLARLDDIVQDYLSLVRVSAMQRSPVDFATFVTQFAHNDIAPMLVGRAIKLHLDGCEQLGTVALHANTFRRALLNLVQNAIDAMPQGGTLTLQGRRHATTVQLAICDTGLGIPPEQLPRIFEPLHTTKATGTGLGLYIVQEVVTAHDGNVTIDSTAGHGAAFTITLPLVVQPD